LRFDVGDGAATVLGLEAATVAFDGIVLEMLQADLLEREFLRRLPGASAGENTEGEDTESEAGAGKDETLHDGNSSTY
jgi:hypothetical protein